MPNTKSAAKRLRQSNERRARNRSIKSNLRTNIRKVREAIAAGNVEGAESACKDTARRLDRAASSRVISENRASRLKSRLQKAIKGLKNAG